jgi:hypothetical protein
MGEAETEPRADLVYMGFGGVVIGSGDHALCGGFAGRVCCSLRCGCAGGEAHEGHGEQPEEQGEAEKLEGWKSAHAGVEG